MIESTVNRHRPPIQAPQGPRHGSKKRGRRRRKSLRRRRIEAVLLLTFGVFFIWLTFSLGGALLNPALGSSFSSRFAEWARGHGASSIVNWAENEWYSHHPPPVGGTLPPGAITKPTTNSQTISTSVQYLATTQTIVNFASPALPGEG